MKKIIFIVPYYGKKPDYFDIWLKSISFNQTVDYLFVSDLDIDVSAPPNFIFLKMTMKELKEKIQQLFDFPVMIDSPYNLCDFKPAYGDVFWEIVSRYDFWGNCDTDQVFGNIHKFLSDKILDNYDRILYLGHFSLYKVSDKMRGFYKLPGALYDYKTVFSSKEWYSFGEVTGTLQISLKNNISVYSEIIYVDTICAYSQLKFYGDAISPKHFVFYWENGEVHRAYLMNGRVVDDEWMYIHLQKRKMNDNRTDFSKPFYICGSAFITKNDVGTPSIEDIMKYSEYPGSFSLFCQKVRYFCKKILIFLKKTRKEKEIWIRQRVARKNMLWPDNPLYK